MINFSEVSEINLREISINDLNISLNDIYILTPAKVGTLNFSRSLFQKLNISWDGGKHSHDLNNLDFVMNNNNNNKLFITCFRNSLDRNISLFFDLISRTEYKHDNNFPQLYLCSESELSKKYSFQELINIFNENAHKINNYYKLWYEKFFNITNIDKQKLTKDSCQLFRINENTYVLFSTLEKYVDNIEKFENFLTFKLNRHDHNSEEKEYSETYKNFKQNIKFDNTYKDEILNDGLFKQLYSDTDIKKFYKNYDNIKKNFISKTIRSKF
jgi:hypothetical protein